jgi:hypothetical protein
MGQVRGDGQHLVMVAGLHDFHLAAGAAPEFRQLLHRRLVGAGRRRQDEPAAPEQLGETRLRPGMLGAGQGMAGDEMHMVGQQRAEIADHRLLHRADVARMLPAKCGAIAHNLGIGAIGTQTRVRSASFAASPGSA